MFCRNTQTLALAALCLSAVSAIDLSAPSLLIEAAQAHRHQNPAPTPTVFHRYIKRQTTETPTYTVTAAPDSTCGFLSASPGNPITCENGGLCSWEADHVTAVMCQKGLEINMKLACIERTLAIDEKMCNDVCQSNEFNLLCTETSAPFCRTFEYPGGIRDFRCASTSVSRIQSADFTYRNQQDREFSTVILGAETTAFSRPSSIETSTRTTDSEDPTDTPSDTPSPSPPPPPSGGGGGGGTNIGAIVGGSVGGAALLAIIGFGIFFMRRRSSKDKAQQQPPMAGAPPPAPPVQQQPYPNSPGAPAEFYGWKGGMTSPVHSPVHSPVGSPPNNQPYDAVSDVSRMSNVYSPSGTQSQTPVPPNTIHEVGSEPAGHHRGQLHEMQ